MRQVFARQGPVVFEGEHYPIPYVGGPGLPAPTTNPQGEALGKALKPIVHPLRADIPIFMGAEGPKNVALAAEIADGWFPFLYAPEHEAYYREALAEGFARPGARHNEDSFEVDRAGGQDPRGEGSLDQVTGNHPDRQRRRHHDPDRGGDLPLDRR